MVRNRLNYVLSLVVLHSIFVGCSNTSRDVENDLANYHILIDAYCSNTKHFPEFNGTFNGKVGGWRPQVFSKTVPTPLSEGGVFFVDRSGKLFELNIPEPLPMVESLTDLPACFVIGCQVDLPIEFSWLEASKLPPVPSNSDPIGRILGLSGNSFYVVFADRQVLKVDSKTPCSLLHPFFDASKSRGASRDSLKAWVR
jgi:hypothetical protein